MSEKLAIETQDLTKSYDGITVVDHLNLQVKEGEVFGLLGDNGAGKTTTILMLLGLTEPASGTARVCGFNPTREPIKAKRLVGYLPEKVGFYENLTPRENLMFIAELNDISYAEANSRIDELLETVGISEAADMTVGKFSRGMKQRLGIADVLIKKPKVVFLDEPTAGLDPGGISQLLDLIASMPKMGTTVVMSSHLLDQVQKVCHRFGKLEKGKMVDEGRMDTLDRTAPTGGRYIIEVRIAQPSPQLVDTVKKIKGVLKVETKDNLLLISTNTDLRSEIAKLVVQSNNLLLEMKFQEFSLETRYLEEQVNT